MPQPSAMFLAGYTAASRQIAAPAQDPKFLAATRNLRVSDSIPLLQDWLAGQQAYQCGEADVYPDMA